MRKAVAGRPGVIDTIFDYFSVQIAHWRYETIPAVMNALLKFRLVSVEYLEPSMFTHF